MLPSPSRLRPLEEPRFSADRAELRLVPREGRAAVLLNANAKRVNPKVREHFERLVPAGDLFYSETLAEAKLHAHRIIQERYSTVMVGGGDGTISHTMNLLIGAADALSRSSARHPLPDIGVLRLGTGNGLGYLTGAGKPTHDVLRVLSGARPPARPLRLIQESSSGWYFPFASLGYDARLLNDYVDMCTATRSSFGRSLAKTLPGYFFALGTRTIPNELKQKKARLKVVSLGRASIIDPETNEEVPVEPRATLFEGSARAVAVGTSPFYGFGMKVLPHARRRSDRFHLRVSTAPISYLLSHLPSLWDGSLQRGFVDFLVEGVRIESTEPLPLQMAGDARGHTHEVELRLAERTFRFIEGTGEVKD
jgi:diacylglycerol kinase family enzyme